MLQQSQHFRLQQGLNLTPGLQQSIRLLHASSQELQQEITEMLETNCFLEVSTDAPIETDISLNTPQNTDFPNSESTQNHEHDTAEISELPTSLDDIPQELGEDYAWDDVYSDDLPWQNGKKTDQNEELDPFATQSDAPKSLRDHLLAQWEVVHPSPTHHAVGIYLIDHLNERGYFDEWQIIKNNLLLHTRNNLNIIHETLSYIQTLEPTGVGARNLAECLFLQLDHLPKQTKGRETAIRLCREVDLARLSQEKPKLLAQELNISVSEFELGRKLLKQMNPNLGRDFAQTDNFYVYPELIVRKKRGKWFAELNPERVPKLNINEKYLAWLRQARSTAGQNTKSETHSDAILADKKDQQNQDLEKLHQQLQDARYFLHSLKSRFETLQRVMESIIEMQYGFFDYGEEAMRPLTLREIAANLELHESTISRATSNKYVQTPRGIFELKFFFSSGVMTEEGGYCSSTAIQAMLKRLIADESPNKPLSDNQLMTLLQAQGIQTARRTIAKYREAIGIPPSHERKLNY